MFKLYKRINKYFHLSYSYIHILHINIIFLSLSEIINVFKNKKSFSKYSDSLVTGICAFLFCIWMIIGVGFESIISGVILLSLSILFIFIKRIMQDLSYLRDQFPSLSRKNLNDDQIIYFDGPGGTQVPEIVISGISDYYKNQMQTPTENLLLVLKLMKLWMK